MVGVQDKIKSDYPACGKDQEETGGELERFDIFPEFEKPILVFEFKRNQFGTLLNPYKCKKIRPGFNKVLDNLTQIISSLSELEK